MRKMFVYIHIHSGQWETSKGECLIKEKALSLRTLLPVKQKKVVMIQHPCGKIYVGKTSPSLKEQITEQIN